MAKTVKDAAPENEIELRRQVGFWRKRFKEMEEQKHNVNMLLISRTQELQKANQEERRLTDFNCRIQLENLQLRSHRDILLSSLGDAQQKIQLMKIKLRPCAHGCGAGVNEDLGTSGLPLTDNAAENT